MSYDLALFNTECYTLDQKKPKAQALGIKGNTVEEIGTNNKIREGTSNKTIEIDGEGRTLLPGFCDAHTHFGSLAIRLACYLDLGQVKSKRELLERVRDEAAGRDREQWVIGVNWDESKWEGDRGFMTKGEIDSFVSQVPVALERVDGHLACVNSRALELLELDPELKGVEREEGETTGRLLEEARFALRQQIEPESEKVMEGLKQATELAHSLGITSVHDVWADQLRLKAYTGLWQKEELNMRVSLFMGDEYLDEMIRLGLTTIGDAKLRIEGLKVFADGSIGAKTAWVSEGYQDNPDNRGYPIYEQDQLEEIILKAHRNGIKVALHVIGDLAIDAGLKAFERALRKHPANIQHRLEHCELITRKQIKEMKKLGLTASIQPNFTGEWGHPGAMYTARFGSERIKTMNPLRWLVEEEVPFLLGSDGMPFHALFGLDSAINAPFKAQKLSVENALLGYTGFHNQRFPGPRAGVIRRGHPADLVLLDGDPYQHPREIGEMEVKMTFFDGELVYSS